MFRPAPKCLEVFRGKQLTKQFPPWSVASKAAPRLGEGFVGCSAEMAVDCRPRKTILVSTNVIRTPGGVMTLSHFSLAGNGLFFEGKGVFSSSQSLRELHDI